jgi:hypothetical protein
MTDKSDQTGFLRKGAKTQRKDYQKRIVVCFLCVLCGFARDNFAFA